MECSTFNVDGMGFLEVVDLFEFSKNHHTFFSRGIRHSLARCELKEEVSQSYRWGSGGEDGGGDEGGGGWVVMAWCRGGDDVNGGVGWWLWCGGSGGEGGMEMACDSWPESGRKLVGKGGAAPKKYKKDEEVKCVC
nr:hypothetical protein [Tanacetum cinerariifolium]